MNCTKVNYTLPVQTRREPFTAQYNFTVCLSPVNNGYSDVGEFLEFMEVNSMFGADHFVFYNFDMGDSLIPFVSSYVKSGKLQVFEWKLPIEMGKKPELIHYYGQLAALNDCLYQARRTSKYVVFSDLDEIITPMRHSLWLDLINNISKSDSMYGGYLFQNVFFRKEWKTNPLYQSQPLVKNYGLHTLLYTKCEKQIWPHQLRSKYIGDPDKIISAGIHNTWQMTRGFEEYFVPSKDGLLFHYRNWEDYSTADYREETRMFDFKDIILKRIQDRLNVAKHFGYKERNQ